jgi:GAF domain-containing protein
MLGSWETWAATARTTGFAGLRVCGWATWALYADIDFAEFIKYEARLTDFLAATGSRMMWLYLFPRFRPEIIRDVLRTHPLAIVGDHVHHDMYFEPPALILGGPGVERGLFEWMRDRLQARARRELAVADLGRLALAGAAPAELMSLVAQLIAAELEVDLVEVSELLPDDGTLGVAAAAGMLPVPVGHARPIGVDAAVFRDTLRAGKPLILADWSEEARDRQLLPDTSEPITSSASVAISIAEDELVFGVLSMHSTEPRIFSEQEVVLLENVAIALAHALDRKRREDEFLALVQHSPDAIVPVDKRLRIRYVNPAFEHLTGRQVDFLIGAPLDTGGMWQPMFATWSWSFARSCGPAASKASSTPCGRLAACACSRVVSCLSSHPPQAVRSSRC